VTPIDVFGQSYFAANAVLSGLFSFVTQWLVLAAVVYVMIRALKGTVTWRPLFIAVGVASIVSVIQVLITIAATTTLPGMIKYPFEFGGMFQISYAQTSLAMFSTASQAIYNSTIAPAINTYIWVSTIAFIAVYAWLAVLTSTIIRAVTDFSWKKSTLTAAVSIVLSYVLISVINVLLQL
jgi:uncharacterized membrane protein YbhN (UPF0104 family)